MSRLYRVNYIMPNGQKNSMTLVASSMKSAERNVKETVGKCTVKSIDDICEAL